MMMPNRRMLEYVAEFVLPSAYALLEPELASQEASALLLAIGLQESAFMTRQQVQGPARGFWQFEAGGIKGVLEHARTDVLLSQVLGDLAYPRTPNPWAILPVLEHNDCLAAVFARALLWTSPLPLPESADAARGWALYTSLWRPGKPRPDTWADYYALAWTTVQADEFLTR